MSTDDMLIKKLDLTDQYSEKDTNKTSLTIRATLQSDSKTLDESEINETVDKINKSLSSIGAELR